MSFGKNDKIITNKARHKKTCIRRHDGAHQSFEVDSNLS